METITRKQLHEIREKSANYDMRIARQEGSVIITGTVGGNLELTYDHASKCYSVKKFNGGEVIFVQITAGRMRSYLAGQYVIELQNTKVVD